jgi:hypothetical protein
VFGVLCVMCGEWCVCGVLCVVCGEWCVWCVVCVVWCRVVCCVCVLVCAGVLEILRKKCRETTNQKTLLLSLLLCRGGKHPTVPWVLSPNCPGHNYGTFFFGASFLFYGTFAVCSESVCPDSTGTLPYQFVPMYYYITTVLFKLFEKHR